MVNYDKKLTGKLIRNCKSVCWLIYNTLIINMLYNREYS